jgi:hypothetical protein
MVKQPPDQVWSSYSINALGKASELCTPHSLYLALGGEPKERQASQRELFKHPIEGKLLEEIQVILRVLHGVLYVPVLLRCRVLSSGHQTIHEVPVHIEDIPLSNESVHRLVRLYIQI